MTQSLFQRLCRCHSRSHKQQQQQQQHAFPAEPKTASSAPDGGWGWVVVVATFLLYVIADGVVYTFGVLLPSLVEHFGEGRAQLGGVGSLMVGVSWGSGPLLSVVNNKCGFRVSTILGGLLTSLGYFMSAFTPNVVFLYFSIGIVAGFGMGLLFLSSVVAINTYFDRRRSRATGLSFCGSGIGTLTFAILVGQLLEQYGWRGTLLVQSGLLLNVCVVGSLYLPIRQRKTFPRVSLVDERGRHYGSNGCCALENVDPARKLSFSTAPTTTSGEDANYEERFNDVQITDDKAVVEFFRSTLNSDDVTTLGDNNKQRNCSIPSAARLVGLDSSAKTCERVPSYTGQSDNGAPSALTRGRWCAKFRTYFDIPLLVNPSFILIALSNLLACLGYCAPYIFLPDIGRVQAGLDESQAAALVSVVGASSTAMRVVFGCVGDLPCVNRLVLYACALTVSGVASTFVILYSQFWMLIVYSAVFGTCMSVFTCMLPVVLVDLFGAERLSDSFGAVLFFCGIGTTVGTPVAGWLYDYNENYRDSFLFAGLSMTASGLVLFPIFMLPWLRRRRRPRAPVDHVTS